MSITSPLQPPFNPMLGKVGWSRCCSNSSGSMKQESPPERSTGPLGVPLEGNDHISQPLRRGGCHLPKMPKSRGYVTVVSEGNFWMNFNMKLWIEKLEQEFIKCFSMQMGCHPEDFVYTCLDIKILFCFFLVINQKITLGWYCRQKRVDIIWGMFKKYIMWALHIQAWVSLWSFFEVWRSIQATRGIFLRFLILANIFVDSHAGGAIFGFEKQNWLDKNMTFSRCSSMIGTCFYSWTPTTCCMSLPKGIVFNYTSMTSMSFTLYFMCLIQCKPVQHWINGSLVDSCLLILS